MGSPYSLNLGWLQELDTGTDLEEPEFNEDWLLRSITDVNEIEERNNIVLFTGGTGSGKSEMAEIVIHTLDASYLQSYRDGTPHISNNIQPLLEAIDADVLGPSQWWHLDEPIGVSNNDWNTPGGQALKDLLTTFRYKRINLAICGPTLERMSPYIRDLCHVWVRMTSPGNAQVKQFENVATRWAPFEERRPHVIGYVRGAPRPPRELRSYYLPIKDSKFRLLNHGWIEILKAKKQDDYAKMKRPYVG